MINAGKHTFIPDDVQCYKDIVLSFGNFCSIASGLKIISGQHPPIKYPKAVAQFPFKENWDAEYYPSKTDGKVSIGHDVWIGEDVTILEGSIIGSGVIVGAKSVVRGAIPPYTIIWGNPAKIRRYRFTKEQVGKLLEIAWWDQDDKEIYQMIPDMKEVNMFIAKYENIV